MVLEASRVRLPETVYIARAPLSFRELCERAVPEGARLVVMDLDRTLHLGRNVGELLGWEISAYCGYGPRYLDELEPRRAPGRFALDPRRPLATLRYVWRSARAWVPPGLFYFVWCKLAGKIGRLRRRAYLRFGPEPVQAVQRAPQRELFRQMAALPDDVVHELVARVWARYAAEQTVEREDLAWLRARCPGVRIVLSTASPQIVADVAAAQLGFDEAIGSTDARINGGRAKLAELRRRFPRLGEPGFVAVGISDTGHGEDHCWLEAFTHAVDVNSDAPFPPLAPAASPLRAVYSVPLLTRAERQARARGEAWLDPRRTSPRPSRDAARVFGAAELEALLAPLRATADRLVGELEARRQQVRDALAKGAVRRARILARDEALLALGIAQALERAHARLGEVCATGT